MNNIYLGLQTVNYQQSSILHVRMTPFAVPILDNLPISRHCSLSDAFFTKEFIEGLTRGFKMGVMTRSGSTALVDDCDKNRFRSPAHFYALATLRRIPSSLVPGCNVGEHL
jgi:hypothetical protein